MVLIDQHDPTAMTSAQSGENYRNWWPHPVMTDFTDHAISLLEQISHDTADRIHMTRRGYVLATRRPTPADLIAELHSGYANAAGSRIRLHEPSASSSYKPALDSAWQGAPDGVDVLLDRELIRATFPDLRARRGDGDPHQAGGRHQRSATRAVDAGNHARRGCHPAPGRSGGHRAVCRFALTLKDADGTSSLEADRLVNAAGPFFTHIAAMLGEELPVSCIYQQKIAFEDREGAIPRTLPFTIDLDGQELAWTDEEREILASDPASAALLRPMPGGIHRRPEGGDGGKWIKLGWAYNTQPSDPAADPPVDSELPGRADPRREPADTGPRRLSRPPP